MTPNDLPPTVRNNLDAVVGGLDELDSELDVTDQYREYNRTVVEIVTGAPVRLTRNGMDVLLHEMDPSDDHLQVNIGVETTDGDVEFRFEMPMTAP